MTFAFFSGFEASAQTVKRIQFAKGKNSATVRDNTGRNGVCYDLRVRSGQKMTLDLNPGSKVGIKVESLYRDIRSLRIYEGATEVQQLIIGKAVLKKGTPST